MFLAIATPATDALDVVTQGYGQTVQAAEAEAKAHLIRAVLDGRAEHGVYAVRVGERVVTLSL